MPQRLVRPTRIVAAVVLLSVVAGAGWCWVRATRPESRLRHGQEAARAGDFVLAEAYARRLEVAGADDHFHLLEGEIAWRQKAPEQALPRLYRVRKDGPLGDEAALLAAQCLMALQMRQDAERALLFVLERRPDDAVAHLWLGILYHDQGNFSRAIRHLERAADLDAADGRALRLLGSIHKAMDVPERAVSAYRESLRRDPNPADLIDIRVELSECLVAWGRYGEALETIEGIQTASAVQMRVEALIHLGREEEVTELLDRGLEKAPDHAGLLRLRGERYLAAAAPSEAARLLERVVAGHLYDFRSRSRLGQAYEALGRSREAAEQFEKSRHIQTTIEEVYRQLSAAEKNPWDAEVRLRLANLYEELGHAERASMWRKAAAACQKTSRPLN